MKFKNNQGELRVTFEKSPAGKLSFSEMGMEDKSGDIDTGFIRLAFHLGQIHADDLYKMPKIEIAYKDSITTSHWIAEFNGEVILENTDHSGSRTVLLLNRKKIEDKIQHHENRLIIHAEFSEEIDIDMDESNVVLFK